MSNQTEPVAHSELVGGGETTKHSHPGGGGGPSTVKKTSDQSNSTTTLADVTELSFSVVAGVYYRFRFGIIFRSAAIATGLCLSVNIPAIIRFGATSRIPIAADGAGGEFQGWITASDDTVIGTGVQAANTDYYATVEGAIIPSANGILKVRFRSEVSASAVTIRQGSYGMLWTL